MVITGPATVAVNGSKASFTIGDTVVGDYVLDDPYKPYLHPLRTLGGRVVSLAMPFDHRHHKGLMYGLVATDVNWWEEVGYPDYVPLVGVQTSESLDTPMPGTIRQQLRWTAEDGSLATFLEDRTISCTAGDGFVRWTWSAKFQVLREVTIRQSKWSFQGSDGTVVNYHGLGLRFPRTFGWREQMGSWSGDGVVRQNNVQNVAYPGMGANELMGTRPAVVVVSDYVDGEIPAPKVSVRITQPSSSHAIFAMRQPYTLFGIGPSVAGPVNCAAGEEFREHYVVDVADGDFG
ncbi:DUF6807 family protein [Kribbella sp. NPDC050820]|uniref:DUF6807 family protein n=1 Tax=Kribbella sp. NPDC050820 TaxID=3155408 RepID=UPI0033FB7289